jgi:hypothetical protein
MGSCRSDSGNISIVFVPRAFSSTVQPWSSSCTSCGSTDLRDHASSHLGFGGPASIAGCCAPFLTFDGPSRPLSLEKKLGIAAAGVVEMSRREAFVPERQLENSLGSAMRRLQVGDLVVGQGYIERQEDGRNRERLRVRCVECWVIVGRGLK